MARRFQGAPQALAQAVSLLNEYMTACTRLVPERTSDGEGGTTVSWTDADSFTAAIVLDTSAQARIAEAAGTDEAFTVTTGRDVVLAFHDVLRRETDGLTFRVTSRGGRRVTPGSAALDMSQVTAERWDLT